ncbi:MAG: RNA methyltransferase [Candidatus Brocadiia bacterium]
MKTTIIDSPTNPRVRSWTALEDARERRASHLFLAEGLRVLKTAAEAGKKAVVLLVDREKFPDLPPGLPSANEVCMLSSRAFGRVSSQTSPAGIAGVFELPSGPIQSLPGAPNSWRALVAWRIQDPGNLGALVRVAAGAGFDAVLSVLPCADFYSPKAVRGSSGFLFKVKTATFDEAEFFAFAKANALVAVSAEASAPQDYRKFAWPPRFVLLLGGEAAGIPSEVSAQGPRVRIPMQNGCESLNVSIAAGILAFSSMP